MNIVLDLIVLGIMLTAAISTLSSNIHDFLKEAAEIVAGAIREKKE